MLKKLTTFILLAGSQLLPAAPAQPNILFIAIDDLRPQIGAYGAEYMVTPNLDSLASQGRLFTSQFVQVPTCGPSRACMLTGKNLISKDQISHHQLGEKLAETEETARPETFIHHLKRNGYHTVGMGKISHNADGHFANKKTKSRNLELPHSWDKFVNQPDSLWKGQNLSHAFSGGKTRKNANLPAFESFDLRDEDYPDGQLAGLAVNELKSLSKSEKPFFMAVGFYKPHLPFCAPKKYWDLYDREKIPLSPNPDLPENVSKSFLHGSSEFFGQYSHPEKGGLGKRLSDDYAREVIHANFASVSYVDAQVGKVLKQLKDEGLDKNTIVIVWGDHGWHLGDHTIWGKHSVFEKALRSAFIVKMPEMPQPGVKTDGLVASVDIYPTVCELAGITPPAKLDGTSFAPLLKDPKADVRDAVLSYWRDTISMRTDRYRLAVFNDGKKQEIMLFDHENDPNETKNIADQNPETLTKLMSEIRELNHGYLPNLK